MEPGPRLYIIHGFPTSRSVMITIKALGICVETHEIDFNIGGIYTHHCYFTMPPKYSVPALFDTKLSVRDGSAISAYLVERYGTNDLLYPKDSFKRALVNRMIQFNSTVLNMLLRSITALYVSIHTFQEILKAYSVLENILEKRNWIADDHVTIADYCCITTVTSLNLLIPIDSVKYPRATAWVEKTLALPCCASEYKELEEFRRLFKSGKLTFK